MRKHKNLGFTVVELIVVIVVIAVLVSITAIAYRTTQADSRDKKRAADAMMIKAAVDEYYADKGSYPMPATACTSPGSATECWRNEAWSLLVTQGYLAKVPTPDTKSWATTYDVNGGNSNYGWRRESGTSYAIYVPLENAPDCKIGRNMTASWFSSAATCNF